MGIRWIRTVIIDGEETTIEIQLGYTHIGDKCYVRIGKNLEEYFTPPSDQRDEIINAGLLLLQEKLKNKEVKNPDGSFYEWN
ncbi:MAG: hypothetical protein ACQEQ4_10050 [Fibrobacterota bacterium]